MIREDSRQNRTKFAPQTLSQSVTQMEDQQALFRLFNPLSPTTRRTTRVLQEIEAHGMTLEELRISQAVQTVPVVRALATPPQERRRLSGNNFDDSFGQAGSPDEEVIQARGRRQVPLTFSPDVNTTLSTPLRQQMARAKLAAMSQAGGRLMLPQSHTRTSPRKRLTLSDSPPSSSPTSCLSTVFTPSPDKLKISPLSKKVKVDPTLQNTSPETAIKGLSHSQLIDLVTGILSNHPDLVTEVHTMIPAPDLAPLEEKLHYLKRNIYKALPSTRLESKTDSMAYNRVSLHLTTFKRAVVESVKTLLESHQWLAVIDFTVLAWAYVAATPVWQNPSHNNIRKTCFKTLAASSMTALKKGNFSKEEGEQIKKKMTKLREASDEINICLKYLEDQTAEA